MSALPSSFKIPFSSSLTGSSQSAFPATPDDLINIGLEMESATYTSAAGNYSITSNGGSDTITTGAGNSIVNASNGNGNNTITTGAGDNSVSTGDGNNTITTGAGNSSVSARNGNNTITTGAGNNSVHTGDGNNTITTGAGDSLVNAGDGNNTITTGAGHAIVTAGNGNNTITTGAGDDVIYSGGGSNTVSAGAGNDALIYVAADSAHSTSHSTYDGGTGIDTLNLVLTSAQWKSSAVQSDIANYLTFLSAHTGASGEADASPFTFSSLSLTAQGIEKLALTVDGVSVDPASHPNTAPTITTDQTSASAELKQSAQSSTLTQLSNKGSIAFHDIDLTDLHTASVAALSSNTLGGTLVLSKVSDSATTGDGNLTWTYTVDNNAAVSLGASQSAVEKFNVTIDDGHGGKVDQIVAVTVNGINDLPVIGGYNTGLVTENKVFSSSGFLTISDPDANQSSFQAQTAVKGTYGSFSIGTKGDWTYTLNNQAPNVQALNSTDHVSDTFTVRSQDDTASQVTISVDGLDKYHAPVAVDDKVGGSELMFDASNDSTTFRSGFQTGIRSGGFDFIATDSNSGLTYSNNAGAANSNSLESSASSSATPDSVTMTKTDGSSFSLSSVNITQAKSGGTETITGYLHNIQQVQQVFDHINQYSYFNIYNSNYNSAGEILTMSNAGFNSVDKVVFSASANNYQVSKQFIDNIFLYNSVTQPRDINVLANDTDVDANALLSVAKFSGNSTYGALITENTDGTLHYDPTVAPKLQGLSQGAIVHDTFTYYAQANNIMSNMATVSIDIVGVAHV